MFRVKTVNLRVALQFVLLAMLSFASSVGLSAKSVVESGENSPGFSYVTDSDATVPVIHYQLHVEMLSDFPDRQTISVYGNGRVVVHNPSYMKKAGDYQMQLSSDELIQLIRNFSYDGMMDFDHKSVKQRVKTYKKTFRDKGQFHVISDAAETVIDIHLDEYQRNKKAKKIKKFYKQFRWKNLRFEAGRYKNDTDINRANNAVNRLMVLKKDVRLVRMEHL